MISNCTFYKNAVIKASAAIGTLTLFGKKNLRKEKFFNPDKARFFFVFE